MSETHLFEDAPDSFCPPSYVVAARRDRSKHGGGVLILIQEHILFEEIDTTDFSVAEKAELVAITFNSLLFVCCYRQPSSADVTLITKLDRLLDRYPSISPIICGDFNVHESTWLQSGHTSSAGTATLDFCESRGLHQLVHFPTRFNTILDLVLSDCPGSAQALPNLNTSDHVVILVAFSSFTNVSPANRRVYHWSRAPWDRLHHHFGSFDWDIPKSVSSAVSFITNVIVSATEKFVPSCIPRLSRPTPWWNRACETAWRKKMEVWKNKDLVGLRQASVQATTVYSEAVGKYQSKLRRKLGDCTGSKQWWSLLKSLTGSNCKSRPAVPSAHQLASYFSFKLSCASSSDNPPPLEDCHHSIFRQFRIKKSQVKSVLQSLDVTKSVGDDKISPRILKFCAQSLCGPLTTLFRMICRYSDFPASWKISRISPIFKKGSRTDPTCYRPIAVLPTLSRVFERLLLPQLS